jgi:hypothetical protein
MQRPNFANLPPFLVSTNWFKPTVFQTDKENQKCAGGAHLMRTGFGNYWMNGALRPLFHQNPTVKTQHHVTWKSTSGDT